MTTSTTAALLEAAREYRRMMPNYYDPELDQAIAAIEQQQEQNNAKPDKQVPLARMTAEALKGDATCNACEAAHMDVRGGYCPSPPNPSAKQTEGK